MTQNIQEPVSHTDLQKASPFGLNISLHSIASQVRNNAANLAGSQVKKYIKTSRIPYQGVKKDPDGKLLIWFSSWREASNPRSEQEQNKEL